jgi:hypothetical protein
METKLNTDYIQQYISSLSEKECKAFHIAKQHLGTLFTVEKTAGYLQWKKSQEKKS